MAAQWSPFGYLPASSPNEDKSNLHQFPAPGRAAMAARVPVGEKSYPPSAASGYWGPAANATRQHASAGNPTAQGPSRRPQSASTPWLTLVWVRGGVRRP